MAFNRPCETSESSFEWFHMIYIGLYWFRPNIIKEDNTGRVGRELHAFSGVEWDCLEDWHWRKVDIKTDIKNIGWGMWTDIIWPRIQTNDKSL